MAAEAEAAAARRPCTSPSGWPYLPALSTALTRNVFGPTDPVSIGCPGATGPSQRAIPVPLASSVHANAARTTAPCVNVAPSAGLVMATLGAALSSAAVLVPFTQIPNAFDALGSGPRSTAPVAMSKRKTLPGWLVCAQNERPSGSSAMPNQLSSPGTSYSLTTRPEPSTRLIDLTWERMAPPVPSPGGRSLKSASLSVDPSFVKSGRSAPETTSKRWTSPRAVPLVLV